MQPTKTHLKDPGLNGSIEASAIPFKASSALQRIKDKLLKTFSSLSSPASPKENKEKCESQRTLRDAAYDAAVCFNERLRKNLQAAAPKSKLSIALGIQNADSQHAGTPLIFSNLFKAQKNPPQELCLPKQMHDLANMKAIQLLRALGVPFTSISKALEASKKNQFTVNTAGNNQIATFSHKIFFLPGATVEFTGSFAKAGKEARIPIRESFQVSKIDWVQSGYPHPSQHNGWCLSEKLIPAKPKFPGNLPLLSQFKEQQREIALDLAPSGRLIDHAVNLLNLKKNIFNSKKNIFLPLSKALDEALCQALGLPAERRAIEEFYYLLENQPSPYDDLCHARNAILEQFIGKLRIDLNKLDREADQEKIQAALFSRIHAIKGEIIKEQAETESERVSLAYLSCMGESISLAAAPLLIQEFSEHFQYQAPPLSLPAKKMQIFVYLHFMRFYQELKNGRLEKAQVEEALEKTLKSDMDFLQKGQSEKTEEYEAAAKLAEELENYYRVIH